jgi:hypothetical protein
MIVELLETPTTYVIRIDDYKLDLALCEIFRKASLV